MASGFVVRDRIEIHAPIERCFLLSTHLAVVERELKMRPVRGRTTGCVQGGDTVRWQGWQLGMPQVHESVIEAFDPPHFFRDRMIDGRFASFEHDHSLREQHSGSVLLEDEIRFALPLGWAGMLAGRLLLLPHIRALLKRRFHLLKRLAESEEWRQYLPAEDTSQS